ncbi:hypothetical protein AB0K14_15560 [Actinosynnema sp. NPDC050801]|jgi:hypothetical protein|uniref:hypothetical protein n=1 Tax=unclassified Actinosynnema TaxID=2637065 RepID=UPI0034088198
MTAILFALTVLALVVYGLERNHQRRTRLGTGLAGSTDVEDRDVRRVAADLRAASVHTTADRSAHRRPAAPVRSMRAVRSV